MMHASTSLLLLCNVVLAAEPFSRSWTDTSVFHALSPEDPSKINISTYPEMLPSVETTSMELERHSNETKKVITTVSYQEPTTPLPTLEPSTSLPITGVPTEVMGSTSFPSSEPSAANTPLPTLEPEPSASPSLAEVVGSTPLPSLEPRVTNTPTTGGAGATPVPSLKPEAENPPIKDVAGCSSQSPCKMCEGDCDEDTDCENGLVCYDPPPGQFSVPGCSGTGTPKNEYCHNPNELQTVVGRCTPSSPCGLCKGDCNTKMDCEEGLACYHRPHSSTEPVPGCTGQGIAGWDYCYVPSPNVLHQGGPPCNNSTNLCGRCRGDCDDDSQCKGSFKCYFRPSSSTEAVPGCDGVGIAGWGYCYKPEE